MVELKGAVVTVITLLVLRMSSAKIEDTSLSVTIDAEGPTPVGSALKFFLRLYDDCARKEGLVACAKLKVAALLERVSRAGDIPLTEWVTLVRSSRDGPTGRAMSENELEADLPAVESGRDSHINDLLLDRLAKSLTTHSFQLNFPKVSAADLRAIGGSSGKGGRMKGMMKMMMMGGAMGIMGMMPIMMGGVTMLAIKAFVVSKLALVLAVIMILKKLLGSGGGGGSGGSSGGGWSSGGGGGGGYSYSGGSGGGGYDRRSMDSAQDLAYSAHIPSNS